MKGVGPFTHTNPRAGTGPPAIFAGRNSLHFVPGKLALSHVAGDAASESCCRAFSAANWSDLDREALLA